MFKVVAPLPIVAVLLLLFAACSDEVTEEPFVESPEPATPAATPEIIGGGEGDQAPYYAEPVVLTTGDYLPEDFDFEGIAERGEEAAVIDRQKGAFEGEVGDFRLYSSFDPAAEKKYCKVVRFETISMMKIVYMPGGTSAIGPQYAGLCDDGTIAGVRQEFITKHGSFDVIYDPGELAFWHDASSDRVGRRSIDGGEAVTISPLVEEGFGRSWASVRTSQGALRVEALNLPIDETLEILEGIECAEC